MNEKGGNKVEKQIQSKAHKSVKQDKGITLIALIITIVVLLILAAVAISSITNDGILSYAQNVAKDYNQATINEQDTLQGYLNYLDKNTGGSGSGNATGYEEVALATAITDAMYSRTANSQTKDIYGNTIKIPAGFKILVDSTTGYTGTTDIAVEKGIVIIDEAGNEFVYVSVGEIKTASDAKNIQLARYEFDTTDGTDLTITSHTLATDAITDPLVREMGGTNIYFTEGIIAGIDDQGKGYALNISDFISKASSGYYIGRYEARTTSSTSRERDDELTEATLNKANSVYYFMTQPEAIAVCKSMYTNKPFTIDLVNSYAWDTAIVFIQEFEDSDYALKRNPNYEYPDMGTVGTENEDKVCNIYDMAYNVAEWTTETATNGSVINCVARGGLWETLTNVCSSTRQPRSASYDCYAFRPILYL